MKKPPPEGDGVFLFCRGPRSAAGVNCDRSTARRLAGDVLEVGAVDADVLQFAIGVARKLVQDVPVSTALFQKARDE
jgi:hypothetical protein